MSRRRRDVPRTTYDWLIETQEGLEAAARGIETARSRLAHVDVDESPLGTEYSQLREVIDHLGRELRSADRACRSLLASEIDRLP
jgi:predicted ATP-grasp superfamily ATP-dependent carboligase